MKKFIMMSLCVTLLFALCACTKPETVATGEDAMEETQTEEVAENNGGVTLIESVDLTEETEEETEKEPLSADFQTLENSYTEHYDTVLAGVTSYAGKMMESAEGIAAAVGEVLVYFNTEEVKAHITAMDGIIAEMETTASSDVDREKIESDKAALQIYKDIQSAYENWDSLDADTQQTVMAYIMALAMSQTSAE